ncbi:MAG: phage tail protein [Deltaproteobacteria bacterium HGW-Deltaproteobacteria-8]|jgi:prophage tail gpP-like protein|nr:MAG: phage tail protein [Deltaproteobacteria bacterium HGW-Deltaproteobacteria-8]
MPAEAAPDTVGLVVGLVIDGHEHRDWERCEVDSDLLTPADGWRMSIGLPENQGRAAVPAYVRRWAPATLTLGGQVIMRGRIDSVESDVGKAEHTLSITGRDLAAVLVDCSAPVFTARQCSLDEIVAKMVRPLGVTNIRVDAGPSNRLGLHDKISVDPGMTAWDALQRVCEQNGCWPYFAPDGTLVIGGPDYSDATNPAVGQLIMRWDGKGNNVLRLSEKKDIQEYYSQVTVLGQAHGSEHTAGEHNIRATAKDSAADFHRPKIVVEADCENVGHAQRRARKIVADGKLAAYEIHARVRGYRVLGAAGIGGAPLWTPGQRVRVLSEPHGINDMFYLMRRTFLCGRGEGQVTELTLKPDGLWQPDVGHHKRHKYKAKAGAGGIVDL